MEPRFNKPPWQQENKGPVFFTPLEIEILMHSYSEFEYVPKNGLKKSKHRYSCKGEGDDMENRAAHVNA